MPTGPEGEAVIKQATLLLVTLMPYEVRTHPICTDLAHPWIKSYHASYFRGQFWRSVDIDTDELRRRSAAAL